MSNSRQNINQEAHDGLTSNHNWKKLYLDDSADGHEREHAFYRYWCHYIETHRGLTQNDLEDMVGTARQWSWWAPLGDCLRQAAILGVLTGPQIGWLLTNLPQSSYGWKQIAALSTLQSDKLDIGEKFLRILNTGADWALIRLIRHASATDLDKWVGYIASSSRPRSAKNRLIEHAHNRMNQCR